ncbi:uncharacterized protein G2W53_015642 [Senna tora]|uniref:Uncharacterized protein n=1 Tax=Senna tora TaxID=362788 RepID=A0A835C5Y2_9FABA|nr:uncharacterized protein G2W53_015642 [Senna tora]
MKDQRKVPQGASRVVSAVVREQSAVSMVSPLLLPVGNPISLVPPSLLAPSATEVVDLELAGDVKKENNLVEKSEHRVRDSISAFMTATRMRETKRKTSIQHLLLQLKSAAAPTTSGRSSIHHEQVALLALFRIDLPDNDVRTILDPRAPAEERREVVGAAAATMDLSWRRRCWV